MKKYMALFLTVLLVFALLAGCSSQKTASDSAKIKKAGKHDIILFSKWTLSHNLVGDTEVGDKSFAEYIKSYFGKEN